MNYKSWDDEGLRRILIADPDDTAAICEAAERFRDQGRGIEMPEDSGDTCAGFPDEDFASGVLKRLRTFCQTLKGERKTECLAIIADLEELEAEIAKKVEYGRDELRKVDNALEEYAEYNS